MEDLLDGRHLGSDEIKKLLPKKVKKDTNESYSDNLNDTNQPELIEPAKDTNLVEQKDKKLSAPEKLLTLIEKELLNKTEEEIKNMPIDDVNRIIGEKTLMSLTIQSKKAHMGKNRFDQMKRDFLLMLKSSLEGQNKSGELQKELSEIHKQLKTDLNDTMQNNEVNIPEMIVDLCGSDQVIDMNDKNAEFKLYIRGLKRAGNLENIESIVNKYKFKSLFNLYKKSFIVSKQKVFQILKKYHEETFHDPRMVDHILEDIFNTNYHKETIRLFAFAFYMLFDNVRDNKIPLDLVVFTKYFLIQLHYLISNSDVEFKSRKLFISSIKRILDKLQLLLLKEEFIYQQNKSIENDKEEISKLREEYDDE